MMDELKLLTRVRGIGAARRRPFQARHILRWAFRSGADLINHCVNDPVLRAIFAAQSGDYGLPPSLVFTPVHAGITHHYFNGGYYPLGGDFAIPRAFARALKRAGGELRLSTRVEHLLVKGNRVTGVRLADGTEITAGHVVSNADPEVTFLEDIYQGDLNDKALHADPEAIFLTVTTLKDPSKMHSGHHTLEAFRFVSYEPFQRWADQSPGDRDWEYQQLKERLTARMLAAIDQRVPGFSKHVVFKELGTPLSNEYYLNATRGNLYGIDKGRFQVGPWAFGNKTEFDGLWLSGASTPAGHGVAGATASGLATAKQILGCRYSELLAQNGPELAIYPSEEPAQWPAKLRRRIGKGKRPSIVSVP